MKLNPLRTWQAARRMIRQPDDVVLSLRLGYFIWRVPQWLEGMPLPKLLERLQETRQDAQISLERVNRLSRPWFRLPPLRGYNTCYLRALMFYRFLDAQGQRMQIHFVVEPPRTANDRLRGHGWVTLGEQAIEPPPPDVVARAQRIYSFPGGKT